MGETKWSVHVLLCVAKPGRQEQKQGGSEGLGQYPGVKGQLLTRTWDGGEWGGAERAEEHLASEYIPDVEPEDC